MQVYIVGAGAGDPELITVKGQKLLQKADVIIYAGSLVNPALLGFAKEGAEIHDSASMTLPEVIETIEKAVAKDLMVVRLHTGDPSIYGAIQEQMDALKKKDIDFEVVPGVSSFLATAAALKQEYTLPGISQTVIITRNEGRTPVPEREKLRSLAAHQATMCIFLSITMLADVVKELMEGGYASSTPIAIVQRASWPEQKIVRATLETIVEEIADKGIDRTAMIVVSRCLGADYELSRLYAPEFSHMFREASKCDARFSRRRHAARRRLFAFAHHSMRASTSSSRQGRKCRRKYAFISASRRRLRRRFVSMMRLFSSWRRELPCA